MSKDGIMVDMTKIEAIHSCPRPTSITEICSFIGYKGYYRHFIEGFSTMASLLTCLTCQEILFLCQRSVR